MDDFSHDQCLEKQVTTRPKTGGRCELTSKFGKTPIGSPSSFRIELKGIDHEDHIELKAKEFQDIKSHKDRPHGFKNIEEYANNHSLKKQFEQTSWNNIPLCIQEFI